MNKAKPIILKQLKIIGLNILTIQEKFNVPHGGCKNSKIRKL
jgi:ribosomal protein S11